MDAVFFHEEHILSFGRRDDIMEARLPEFFAGGELMGNLDFVILVKRKIIQ